MKAITIDITGKVIEIICSQCDKPFYMHFDEIAAQGTIYCPYCKHPYFVKVINYPLTQP